MPLFATPADLEEEVSADTFAEVGDDAARLLRRASELVEHAARAGYDLTNLSHADALMRATCAVVEQWPEVGEANDIDGLAGTAISVTGYSGTRAPALPPRAYRALADAGLVQPLDGTDR